MPWTWVFLPGFLAALVTLACTPLAIRWAHRLQAVDVPGGRKHHTSATPRLGGLPILAGIIAGLAPAVALLKPDGLRATAWELAGFGLAVSMIFLLGFADDIAGLGISVKFLVQIGAAAIVVSMGWQFTTLRLPVDGPYQLGALGPLLSLIWIVGVTNAINLIDGLDGLAAGVVAIIGSSLLALAILQDSPQTIVVMSCIVGSCSGFLRHNWRPAKIFLGDSGSLTLGFFLAVASLRSAPSVKASAALALLVPVLALGLPVIDTLLVMWSRFLRGHATMNRFARMFQADRAHVHHLLMDRATSRPTVMLLLYGLAVAFCAMSLLVAASQNWNMGVAFLLIEVGAVILVRRFGLRDEARRVAARKIERLESAAQGHAPRRSTPPQVPARDQERIGVQFPSAR